MTITTEQAERLAERLAHDAEAPSGARYQPYTDHAMRNAAAALRALAAERDALQARVAELERLAGLADSWITAALECEDWHWDADQKEAATHTRDELRATMEGKKDE